MPRTRRVSLIAAAIMTTSMVVTPVAGARSTDAGDAQTPKLEWKSCRGGAQCATLRVPLDDMAAAGGPTIRIAVTRVRTGDPDRRVGSLVVNPGGPGVPGADFAIDIADFLPSAIRDRFDIVGFDPRGTGDSAPVDCTDELDGYYDLDFAPEDSTERTQLVDGNQALVEQCTEKVGDLLPYISTRRTARDLDRIRAALGEKTLSFLGFSYGTYLGASYADQFPQRVRAFVLDGAVDPALDAAAVQVEQAVGFERSLQLFLDDCRQRESCTFHQDGDPAGAYDELRAKVAAEPIPADDAGDGRTLNGTLFDIGVTQVLYSGDDGWEVLAEYLQDAYDGDGSSLVLEADTYIGRASDGSYDDIQEAFLAIGCVDGPDLGGLTGLRAIEDRAEREAPRLGRSIVNASMPCAMWPVPVEAAPLPRAAGAAPILVLGTTNDPATPLAWARGLAGELESGRLVTARGSQHTAFAGNNACVNRLVARYLVRLAVPAEGTRC